MASLRLQERRQPCAVTLPALLIGIASVIDGDTLEIHGKRVRLHGVDAPESRQMCERDGKPWRCGADAANALDAFIAGRTVSCEPTDVDRYKRIVAKCSVGGIELGAWLVGHGWALDYERYSKGAYARHQAEAESAKAGVWGGRFEKPWEWRKRSRRLR